MEEQGSLHKKSNGSRGQMAFLCRPRASAPLTRGHVHLQDFHHAGMQRLIGGKRRGLASSLSTFLYFSLVRVPTTAKTKTINHAEDDQIHTKHGTGRHFARRGERHNTITLH